MFRRFFVALSLLFITLCGSGLLLVTGNRLESTFNMLLPNDWRISLPQNVKFHSNNATFPLIHLSYQDCDLLSFSQFTLQWWKPKIITEQAVINYACFSLFSNEEKPSTGRTHWQKWLGFIPDTNIQITNLVWKNIPESAPIQLRMFLAEPSNIQFVLSQEKVSASLTHPYAKLAAEWFKHKLEATFQYQSEEKNRHQLQLTAIFHSQMLWQLESLMAKYQWQLPTPLFDNLASQQGEAILDASRQEERLQGRLQLTSAIDEKNQLTVPFYLDQHSIGIEQAYIYWKWLPEFPLNAFINAKFSSQQGIEKSLLPLDSYIRISLLSQTAKGKGNLVIHSPNGVIEHNRLHLPFQINGELKYKDIILYSAIPSELKGEFDNLTFHFLPTALLRLTGNARFLTINDLRFPLAGIRVNKYGIDGRLQAIFKGESPDFRQIVFHLDGYAKHFHAGQSFFQTQLINEPQNQWNWRFWGGSQLHSLNSQLTLSGRGHWYNDLVTLSEFSGELNQIKQNSVVIPKTELSLLAPIKFAYKNFYLDGKMRLSAPYIHFDYGGRLTQPNIDLSFNGETETLQFKGEFNANKLGPIRVFARRQLTKEESSLIGRLYWLEQPADVFQSFFPPRSQWLITQGRVKGETAFSVNTSRGLIAGGHFSLHDGAISLPNGAIEGIHFSLPYRFEYGRFLLGQKQAVDIRIDLLNLGVPMSDFRAKVQGYYPYSSRKPLRLSQLAFKLLDGSLNIEHFALPQSKVAILKLQDISLSEILKLAQYHQLQLSGKINATLPFWLNGKPCYICDGEIEQVGYSTLTFTPELLKAIQQAGYTERILAYTVHHSRLKQLNAKINLNENGVMQLRTQIHSELVENERTKIHLNYNHTENIFDLWRSINYGTQLENQLEHSIYKQIEEKSK